MTPVQRIRRRGFPATTRRGSYVQILNPVLFVEFRVGETVDTRRMPPRFLTAVVERRTAKYLYVRVRRRDDQLHLQTDPTRSTVDGVRCTNR